MRGPRTIIVAGLILGAGCSPAAEEVPQNQAAAPKPEKAPHCFFKDNDTKDWVAKVEGEQVVVTGRAFRSDARYKAVLLEPKVEGPVAVLRPSISLNDTGFAAEGNWWDLTASIPAAGLEKVEVRCGKKIVAALELPAKAG